MLLLSATDLAIRSAQERGTLKLTSQPSRLGGTFVSIADEFGLIEVQLSWAKAHERLAFIEAGEE